MACIPMRRDLIEARRRREIEDALKRLEEALVAGQVTLNVDPFTGGITLEGYASADYADINDGCALRELVMDGSMAALEAVATAEAMSGMNVGQNLMMGLHSHDGGATWGVD